MGDQRAAEQLGHRLPLAQRERGKLGQQGWFARSQDHAAVVRRRAAAHIGQAQMKAVLVHEPVVQLLDTVGAVG
jgi:hypothetical protein